MFEIGGTELLLIAVVALVVMDVKRVSVDADTGDIPTGPMVLAVRCSRGHHNAPHATRCRVCGQDLPPPVLGEVRTTTLLGVSEK